MKYFILATLIVISMTNLSASSSNFFYKVFDNDDINLAVELYSDISENGFPLDLENVKAGSLNGQKVALSVFGKEFYQEPGRFGEPKASVVYGVVKASGNSVWVIQVSDNKSIQIEKDYILNAVLLPLDFKL